MARKKVIIIGAGIAGISAAIELAENDIEVLILESKNSVGGRLFSILDQKTGDNIDNGQHAMMGAYKSFFRVLETLGTRKFITGDEFLNVPFSYPDGFIDRLNTKSFNTNFGLLKGLFGLKRVSAKSKFLAILFFLKLKLKFIKAGNQNVYEFLEDQMQPEDIIKKFWEPLVFAVLNGGLSDVSAVLLLEVLNRAFLADSFSGRLLFSEVALSDLFAPFQSWLSKKGGNIIFGEAAKSIEFDQYGAHKILTNNNIYSNFDYVLSTVQPNSLNKLLPKNITNLPYFSFIQKFEYSTIISVYLWVDEELTNEKFVAFLGTHTQWLFNLNKIRSEKSTFKNAKGFYSVTISGANHLADRSSDEIVRLCVDEITNSLIKTKPNILHYRVFKDKSATFKASPEFELLRPDSQSPVRNLLLAGDWTNTGLPATIEGASESGFKAATEIIQRS